MIGRFNNIDTTCPEQLRKKTIYDKIQTI